MSPTKAHLHQNLKPACYTIDFLSKLYKNLHMFFFLSYWSYHPKLKHMLQLMLALGNVIQKE